MSVMTNFRLYIPTFYRSEDSQESTGLVLIERYSHQTGYSFVKVVSVIVNALESTAELSSLTKSIVNAQFPFERFYSTRSTFGYPIWYS